MLSQQIASRYLFSRKSHSIINIISMVSGIAIAIPVTAMVVILSFHNGLNDYIKGLYEEFDPDIRVVSATGRDFKAADANMEAIKALPETAAVSEMLEENVYLRLGNYDHRATLRGVDAGYREVVPIGNRITAGQYTIQHEGNGQVLIGNGIAYALGAQVSISSPIEVHAMMPDQGPSVFAARISRKETVQPTGIYELDKENDSRYIFSGIDFARRLLGRSGLVSSLEMRLVDGADPEQAQRKIENIAGEGFVAKTRFQQKETIYKAVNQEKWIIYLLLMMVIMIASLSLAGAVVMLAAEKRDETDTLRTMGATTRLIRNIFLRQGVMIAAGGILCGAAAGILFALAQQQWGIIKMGGSSFLMQAYPSRVDAADIAVIAVSVLLLGALISLVTSASVIKKETGK